METTPTHIPEPAIAEMGEALQEDEIVPSEDWTVPIEEPPTEPEESVQDIVPSEDRTVPIEEPPVEPEVPVEDIVPSDEPITPVEIQATPFEDETAPMDEPTEPAEPVQSFPYEVDAIPSEDHTSPVEEPSEPPQEIAPFDEPTTPVEMISEDLTAPISEPPAEPSVPVGVRDIPSEDQPGLDEESPEPPQAVASFDEPTTPIQIEVIPSEDQTGPEETPSPSADQIHPEEVQAIQLGEEDVPIATDITSQEEQFPPLEPVTIKSEEFVPSEEEEKEEEEETSATAVSQDDEEWIVVDSTAPAEQEEEDKQPAEQLLQLGDEGEGGEEEEEREGGDEVGFEGEGLEDEGEGGKEEEEREGGDEVVGGGEEREELEDEGEGEEVKDKEEDYIPEYQPEDVIEFEEEISLEKEVTPEAQPTLGDGEYRSESLMEPLSPYYERPVPSEKPPSPDFTSSSPIENDFDGAAEPVPSQVEELPKEPEYFQPQDEESGLGERDEGDQLQSPLGSSFLPVSVQEASADERSETSSTAAVPTTPPLSMVVERGSPVPELTEASVTSLEDDEQEDPDVRDGEAHEEGPPSLEGGADDGQEMPSSPIQEELQATDEGVARVEEGAEIGDPTEDGEDEAQDGGGEEELGVEGNDGEREGEGEEGGDEAVVDLLGDDTLATPIQLQPDPQAQGIVDNLLDFEPQAAPSQPAQPDPFGMDPLELVTTPPHHQQQNDIFGQDPFGAASVDPNPVEQHYNPFAPGGTMDPFSMGGQDFGGAGGDLNQPAQDLLDPLGDEGGWAAGGLQPERPEEGDDLRDSGVQSPDILQPESEGGGSSRGPEFGEGGSSSGGPEFGDDPAEGAADRFRFGGMGEETEEGAFGLGSSADPAPADEDLGSPVD